MIVATPNNNLLINNIIKKVDELSSDCYEHITSNNVYKKQNDSFFLNKFKKIKDKVTNLYEDHLFDDEGLRLIEKDIFMSVENMNHFDIGFMLTTLTNLHTVINKIELKKQNKKIMLEISVTIGKITRIDNSGLYNFRRPTKTNNRFSFLLQISRADTPASKLKPLNKKNSYISKEIKNINETLQKKLSLKEKLIININDNSGYKINKDCYEIVFI